MLRRLLPASAAKDGGRYKTLEIASQFLKNEVFAKQKLQRQKTARMLFFVAFALVTTAIHAQQAQNMVLTSNITLENWDPADFAGRNLYGNGHTITIRSFAAGKTDYGFFGTVNGNAVIRDVTIMYDASDSPGIQPVTVPNATRFGGIAGTASGKAQFINVLVKGAVNTGTTGTVGGMAGLISGAGVLITNAYSELKITTGTTVATIVGGIAGEMTAGTIDGVTVVADITVTNASGNTRVGGITGSISNLSNPVSLNDCIVRGNIDITSSNTKNIGGVIGYAATASPPISVSDSFFETGIIEVKEASGNFQIGGFAGYLNGPNITITNCGTLGGDILIISGDYSSAYIGGFTSLSSGTFSNCFSRINIDSFSRYATDVGGFMGRLQTGGSINNCYATGTVRSVQNGDVNASIGGLVGYKQGGTITNSYALGNVLADKQGGTGSLHVGGIVGWNQAGDITNSFAAGQVSAQSNHANGSFAGGLVGYRQTGTITNSVALGASVTALAADGSRGAGRIYGFPTDQNIGTGNRANRDMVIGEDIYTNALNPNTRNAATGLARPDGESTAPAAFLNSTTWTGMSFTTANGWNFSNVGREGFPRLLNMAGQ
jgi:hypothetical protein